MTGFDAAAVETSFLGAAMVLTFSCLFTVTGVLIEVKRDSSKSPRDGATRFLRVLLLASPLAIYAAMPMAHLLGPLLVFRTAGSVELRRAAARSLNFQITWTLFAVVALLLCVVLVGVFMAAALLLFHLVVSVAAAARTLRGGEPVYPLSVEFVPVTGEADARDR